MIDFSDMRIYKLHVRGFTMHESSGVKNPGTFTGLKQKLKYIKDLGFNTLLLMPCYEFESRMKVAYGQPEKTNFWGYGAQGSYFSPKRAYAADPEHAEQEFAGLVRAVHKAGMELFMEMDFAEGTADITMLEAVRFWHERYGVDGFRLMSGNIFPRLFATDPKLNGVRLIGTEWSEACLCGAAVCDESAMNPAANGNAMSTSAGWGNAMNQAANRNSAINPAAGEGDATDTAANKNGTQHAVVSRQAHRPRLAVCNDTFAMTVRSFLKGDEGQVRTFSEYMKDGGGRTARVNYIADHDGFTLADLYSYDEKHNEANGENNADGREINFSWNCGVEGVTTNRRVQKLRLRMMKNALTALFLSQGTPMLMAGDEFGCTHQGNNNPYCCDDEQGWVVWKNDAQARKLREYVRQLIAIRGSHRAFSNVIALKGADYIYSGCPDISFHGTKAWYPDYGHFSRTLGILLNGEYARVSRTSSDASFYVVFNMHWESHEFDLPTAGRGEYRMLLTTAEENIYEAGRTCVLAPRSMAVFEVLA